MAEDMEMFLEQVIKKTNPEEYIKILEQDREDFAEEINRLQEIIDKAIEYIEKYLQEHVIDEYPDEQSTFYDEKDRFIPNAKEQLLDILQGKEK